MELTRRNKQRSAALDKARAVRSEIARFRSAIRSGEIDGFKLVEGRLEEHEERIARWRLETLLKLIPGIGSSTAQEIYEVGPFSPTQLVGSLSPQRRARLAQLVYEGRHSNQHRRFPTP